MTSASAQAIKGKAAGHVDHRADAPGQLLHEARQDEGDERQQENGQERNAHPFQDCAEVKEKGRIHGRLTGYLFASRAA
jgi:hypothetical protein